MSDGTPDYPDPERVIEYAALLEPGDEVYVGTGNRLMSNPLIVREVEVTDWGAFRTARVRLNFGVKRFGDPDHIVTACSGETPRWQQADRSRPLHRFDPVDYDLEDLAARHFGERMARAMWSGGEPADPEPLLGRGGDDD